MGQNATYIKIKIGSTDLIGEVSSSLSSSVDAIDVSSKANGRIRNVLPGRVAENISFESLADDTNTTDYGYDDAYTAMAAGTKVSFTIYRVDSEDVQVNPSQEITGSGYITSLTLDNPDNDRSTMSGTIEIDDELTVGTYAPV
jgi:hypothetical protein